MKIRIPSTAELAGYANDIGAFFRAYRGSLGPGGFCPLPSFVLTAAALPDINAGFLAAGYDLSDPMRRKALRQVIVRLQQRRTTLASNPTLLQALLAMFDTTSTGVLALTRRVRARLAAIVERRRHLVGRKPGKSHSHICNLRK